METTRDFSRWAKKFDEVAHLYKEGGNGTECGSVAACLGSNYAETHMQTCPKCEEIRTGVKRKVDRRDALSKKPRTKNYSPDGYNQKLQYWMGKITQYTNAYDMHIRLEELDRAYAFLPQIQKATEKLTYFTNQQVEFHKQKGYTNE